MKILVTLDGSPVGEAVLPEVKGFVEAFRPEVCLLRIYEPPASQLAYSGKAILDAMAEARWRSPGLREQPQAPSVIEDGETAKIRVETEQYLEEKARHIGSGGIAVKAIAGFDAAESIIDFARDGGFDLIVMATHGRTGLRALLMGSVAQQVLSSGVLPVMLIRPGPA